jgi:hypothetical protein
MAAYIKTDFGRPPTPKEVEPKAIAAAIRKVLHEIFVRRPYESPCALIVLYQLDTFSGLLEPMYFVPRKKYAQTKPVPSNGDDHFANLAFKSKGPQFSQNPLFDDRLGPDAKLLIKHYNITGSLISYPLGKVGVVVIATETMLSDNPTLQTNQLSQDFINLAALVALRDTALARKVAQNYEELTQLMLSAAHPIPTAKQIQKHFQASCHKHLRATASLLVHPGKAHSLCNSSDLEQLQHLFGTQKQIIFNRVPSDASLSAYKILQKVTGLTNNGAFAAAACTHTEPCLYAIAYRKVTSITDHWNPHDLRFLHFTLKCFQFLMKRRSSFGTMLQQLREPQLVITDKSPFSRAQFDLICYICKEFLNVDQILLTRVTREAEQYHIRGVFAHGFGKKDNWIKKVTAREYAAQIDVEHEKLDVMPYVLEKFLNVTTTDISEQKVKTLYCGLLGASDSPFTIDDKIVKQCKLCGKVYFLPCFTITTNGTVILRSILHLGRADGKLQLPDEVKPLLSQVARGVAEGFENTERDQMEAILRQIHRHDKLTPDTIRIIAEDVSTLCRSVGCAIFLKVDLIHLVGFERADETVVKNALQHFLSAAHRLKWAHIDPITATKIREMLCAFLGTDKQGLDKLLGKRGDLPFTSLAAKRLYVRVGRSGETIKHSYFHDVIRQRSPDELFLPTFAAFLSQYCYLPGYGLTGWVIRYRYDMRLRNKRPETIDQFFQENRAQIKAPPLNMLAKLQIQGVPSYLRESPIVKPAHVDHIQDRAGISHKEDTFLACALEDVDHPNYACGVVRTSTSETLRADFENLDQENLKRVATHLSNVVRKEFTAQQQFMTEIFERRHLHQVIRHSWRSFGQNVRKLQQRLKDPDKELSTILNVLEHTGHWADHFVHWYDLGDDITHHTLPDSINEYRDLIERALAHCKNSFQHFQVTCLLESKRPQLSKEQLLLLATVVEEVVTNIKKHSSESVLGVIVTVGMEQWLEIQIMECAASKAIQARQLFSTNTWLPYDDLLNKPESTRDGEGRRIIEEGILQGIIVRYAILENNMKLYSVTVQV